MNSNLDESDALKFCSACEGKGPADVWLPNPCLVLYLLSIPSPVLPYKVTTPTSSQRLPFDHCFAKRYVQ